MTLRKILLIALTALTGFSGSAHAILLEGQVVRYQYLFPDMASVFPSSSNGNYLVGPGVEVDALLSAAGIEGPGSLDLSDTNLLVDFSTSQLVFPAPFNGFQVTDIFGTIAPFTGVTINGATNLAGFDASRIVFDADNIFVNLQGLEFTADSVLSLDLAGGDTPQGVPEPDSALLVGLGLLAVLARRRTRTGAASKARQVH